jgi:Fe-S-cluster containining protein
MTAKDSNGSIPEEICLTCGLCCNGTIFADVALQPGDNVDQLESAGMVLCGGSRQKTAAENHARFSQPCAAFDGCRCRVYQQRPQHCRTFECLLLKSVKAGAREAKAALSIIRSARDQADRVWRLLRELEDTDEDLPLKARFERTSKRLEQRGCDDRSASMYGELTLTLHALNLLLSESFYR